MHDKLSQAVKMYDNLLTEQFTQTSRRQQALSQPAYPQYTPYQPQQLSQPPQQWGPQAVPASPYPGAYSAQSPARMASPSAPEQSWNQSSMTYRPQANPPSPVLSRAPYSNDYVSAQPNPTQPTHYPMQQQPAYAPSLPPVTLPLSPGMEHTGYQPAAAPHHTMTSQPSDPISAAPTPATPQQPPVPQHTYQNYNMGHQILSRSNTVTSSPHAQPPQHSYANHPHYQQQQQQQRVAPSAPPVAMPILPTAPTNAPSAYPLYGPSAAVPSAPASEPKEAMLISFD